MIDFDSAVEKYEEFLEKRYPELSTDCRFFSEDASSYYVDERTTEGFMIFLAGCKAQSQYEGDR